MIFTLRQIYDRTKDCAPSRSCRRLRIVEKVIAAALVIGVVDYSLLALTSSIWQLYVVQVLHVAVIVGMFGVGITYLQGVSSRQPGLASSTFFAAQGVATPLGGLMGGLGVGVVGLPGMFWLPAMFCLLCWICFSVLMRRGPLLGGPWNSR